MEQLPPKAPNMTQNWASSFPLQMMPIPSIPMGSGRSATSAVQPPSWVDEFLDFSFAKRNAHRRFVSDSMSFLPLLEDCPTSSPPTTAAVTGRNIGSFEQLDDEQLKSMFADETAVRMAPTVSSCKSNPSTPSDENSDGEKPTQPQPLPPQDHQQRLPKEEPREGDDSCKFDSLPTKPADVTAASGDTIVDPKRVKRILANRQSAQRSRVRKLQYISELERSVTTLQTEVSALSPRVAFLDHQRLILNVDNSAIKQRIAALVQDKIFKDAHQEALKMEIERLRQVYEEQNLKKLAMAASATTGGPPPPPPPPPPPSSENNGCTDKDNTLNR